MLRVIGDSSAGNIDVGVTSILVWNYQLDSFCALALIGLARQPELAKMGFLMMAISHTHS